MHYYDRAICTVCLATYTRAEFRRSRKDYGYTIMVYQ